VTAPNAPAATDVTVAKIWIAPDVAVEKASGTSEETVSKAPTTFKLTSPARDESTRCKKELKD
jgi:hypothetical protein